MYGLRSGDEHKEEAEAPSSPISDGHLDGIPSLDLVMCTLRKAHAVHGQTIASDHTFILGEEFRFCGYWVVEHDEYVEHPKGNSDESFDDLERTSQRVVTKAFPEMGTYEEPSPVGHATETIYVVDDHPSEQTRKSTGHTN